MPFVLAAAMIPRRSFRRSGSPTPDISENEAVSRGVAVDPSNGGKVEFRTWPPVVTEATARVATLGDKVAEDKWLSAPEATRDRRAEEPEAM